MEKSNIGIPASDMMMQLALMSSYGILSLTRRELKQNSLTALEKEGHLLASTSVGFR